MSTVVPNWALVRSLKAASQASPSRIHWSKRPSDAPAPACLGHRGLCPHIVGLYLVVGRLLHPPRLQAAHARMRAMGADRGAECAAGSPRRTSWQARPAWPCPTQSSRWCPWPHMRRSRAGSIWSHTWPTSPTCGCVLGSLVCEEEAVDGRADARGGPHQAQVLDVQAVLRDKAPRVNALFRVIAVEIETMVRTTVLKQFREDSATACVDSLLKRDSGSWRRATSSDARMREASR